MPEIESIPGWANRVIDNKPPVSNEDLLELVNTQKTIVRADASDGKTIKTDLYGWAFVINTSPPGEQSVILFLRLPGTYDPEDVYKICVPNEWMFEVSQELPI